MSDIDEEEAALKRQLESLPPIRMKQCDFDDEQTNKIRILVAEALGKHKLSKEVAESIKTTMDQDPEFNIIPGKGPWHCVVGKSFGGSIAHERNHAVLFDDINSGNTILLFKSMGAQSTIIGEHSLQMVFAVNVVIQMGIHIRTREGITQLKEADHFVIYMLYV
ncbi:dynein light chain, cytoplasmic, putative [Perkinsus marinus ATCC 50983]|uniref:Dynein light chain, cytoplasmic, putative n=1 Tax=Perkinsus marinus (strain ATCC 50983 / TXsc) TaxID=423536 RepID=C5K493_PERM5|nr:dynein light chain, cytoplasmic, putative [Perkinsus marinus ATCC 50983]EER20709.1 dynein light chain, cytoplasmic, putative [Perkinsus marinus ATCC 50983]|eukprot:XP_002788913.1 dynein light chain, cytoplasmic, putative [Perkinsus marinus ATCC 50983]